MRIFGVEITRTKALPATLSSVPDGRSSGWFPVASGGTIHEPFPGAWQQNLVLDQTMVLSFWALTSCLSLISSDIAKLRIKLVERNSTTGIWTETTNPAYSPVLRQPNNYQLPYQFIESWVLSKLTKGNTYVLLERDLRGVVDGMTVLDPTRVTPMVADDGSVFYRLQSDNLAGLRDPVLVPASEIIHDRMYCLFHPLCGVSPIFAAQYPAWQGLQIQTQSTSFFQNRSMPGGILTAPGHIQDDTAKRLKDYWDNTYTGNNAGKVALLGDGITFSPIAATAESSQLIEQLKMGAEAVAGCFHVPLYKLGLGPMPTNNNVQALNVEYYQTALQIHIESIEACLDKAMGIGWGANLGTELDTDNLLRMDTMTQMLVLKDGVGAGVIAPDEGRAKLDLPPVKGGKSPYLQQQNFSLEALAKRDALDDPFAPATPPSVELPKPPSPPAGDAGNVDGAKKSGIALLARRSMARRSFAGNP